MINIWLLNQKVKNKDNFKNLHSKKDQDIKYIENIWVTLTHPVVLKTNSARRLQAKSSKTVFPRISNSFEKKQIHDLETYVTQTNRGGQLQLIT